MNGELRIGVDVGGTNTDAALLRGAEVLATLKTATTKNANDGVFAAIQGLLDAKDVAESDVAAVMIGTTRFLNAVIQRQDLQKVGVFRLCGSATRSLPPMVDWPRDLRDRIGADCALVAGGVEFDGRPIAPLDSDAIRLTCREWRNKGIEYVAICSVFALVDSKMEIEAARIVEEEMPGVGLSLSHRIGHTGLLQRESATILNASLMKLGSQTVAAFQSAFSRLNLECALYLTQNDGTVMSADYAARYPIFTIASGPTNSMRGAAFLSGIGDAIVIDIGGTTTDIGLLSGGFPRSRGEGAEIAGVRTNFRVPDVFSMGLGGGSIVRSEGRAVSVGPESVGYRLTELASVFGGKELTATDIAVAGGQAVLGDPLNVDDLDPELVGAALAHMKARIEDIVDRMKPGPDPIPAILVGGGSVLIGGGLKGCNRVEKPAHFGSANAIGAAIAQISGEVDTVVSLDGQSREAAIQSVIGDARERAVEAGASARNLEVVELSETPLAYLPGNAVRMSVKVVGDLDR